MSLKHLIPGKNKLSRNLIRMGRLTVKCAAGKSTIHAWIAAGDFPNGFRLNPGGRARFWFEDEIDAYLEQKAAEYAK